MFERKEETRRRRYRTAMKGLQPVATEASALRLAGQFRGFELIVPLTFVGQGARADTVRDQ